MPEKRLYDIIGDDKSRKFVSALEEVGLTEIVIDKIIRSKRSSEAAVGAAISCKEEFSLHFQAGGGPFSH